MTSTEYRITGGTPWPPVFPYSLNGWSNLCLCTWVWSFDKARFVKIVRKEGCVWCAMRRVAMSTPAEGSADPTTIQVSRAQRVAISDIQAELVVSRRRHVTTKETLSLIIEFWKDNHHDDSQE